MSDELDRLDGGVTGPASMTGTEYQNYMSAGSTGLGNIAGLFSPYKKLFEKITSGNAGATEYAAAAGILGLLVPSLNKPQTPGWKGSIDLTKQYTRTPIAQPAYTPYAQSASPVMGRQFFNTTYGAAPAPAPATPAAGEGIPAPVAPPTTNPDLHGAGLARGGIAGLRRFDGGGNVDQPKQPKVVLFGDSISADVGFGKDAKADTKYGNTVADILSKQLGVPVDLQAVGGATTKDALTSNYLPGGTYEQYLQSNRPDVVLLRFGAADAIRLNDPQQTLSNLQAMVDLAKEYGATPIMIGVSPFAPGNDIRAGNINEWSVDPYLKSAEAINQGIQNIASQNQLPFVDMQRLEVPEGALLDGVHPTADFGKTMADYIGKAVSSALPQFGGSFENYQQTFVPQQTAMTQAQMQEPQQGLIGASTVPETYAPLAVQEASQQPATGLAAALPSGWGGYGAEQKIDWYNQNKVTPEQLMGAGAGVTQQDIDWMKQHGYAGSYETPAAQPLSQFNMAQPMTETSPMGSPVQQTGIAQALPTLPQTPPPQPAPEPMPRSPIPFEEPQIVEQAAQGGIMGYARGGRSMPPRYLRGQTDGMADRIPSNIDGVQPAKLSHGEFVIPADVVSHLGNGNSDAGAKVLYKMMDRVRQARTGNKKQGRQINPEKFTPGGIAGYAGGGAVAFQTGGVTGSVNPSQAISNEQNISEWAGPYVGDMLSKTAALTNTPYQAYQGPLVAGTAPLQSKVFSGLESLNFPGQLGQSFTAQGAYQLPSMTPGGVMGQATGPTGIASQYMNPYLSAVLTPQLDELRRQSQITQMGTAGKLAQAGAFGGSRQAIMDAETQRNLLAEQNKAIGTGYANAYDRAMGQFNIEQGQAKTLADMMAGAGQQQRGIEQEGITALQKQYETELLDPYVKLRFQKEMLQGLPVATASTTANQSTTGQIAGGLASVQELMKQLGLA